MCNQMMRSCHALLGFDWWMKIMAHKQTLSLSLPHPPWIRQHLSLALGADSRGEDIWHLFNTISSSVVALLREGGYNYDRRLLKLKATWCQTEAALKEIHEWRFLFGDALFFLGPFRNGSLRTAAPRFLIKAWSKGILSVNNAEQKRHCEGRTACVFVCMRAKETVPHRRGSVALSAWPFSGGVPGVGILEKHTVVYCH